MVLLSLETPLSTPSVATIIVNSAVVSPAMHNIIDIAINKK